MRARTLATAVVGLGKIAQLKYLPYIAQNPCFELRAICDRASDLVDAVGQQYGVQPTGRVTSVERLPREALDLVFILTHDHYEPAQFLCDQGLSLFVEKPLCWHSNDVLALRSLATARGASVHCGYMRRYDPHVRYLLNIVHNREPPFRVDVRSYAGDVKRWNGDLPPVIKPSPGERMVIKSRLERSWDDFLLTRLGPNVDRLGDPYKILLQLGIHDINLIQSLIGEIRSIGSASTRQDERGCTMITADLDTELGISCHLEVCPAFAGDWLWREEIDVLYSDSMYRLRLGNPFLPYCDTVLEQRRREGECSEPLRIRLDAADPFQTQVETLAEVLDATMVPTIGTCEALADLRTIEAIMKCLQSGGTSRTSVPDSDDCVRVSGG